MALVVLLRGVNVGGHRTFRPATLAKELEHLGAVNIGAAGTFVIRERVGRAELRAELARRLPFDTEIVICEGREILRLASNDVFARPPAEPGIVRFVSVLVGDLCESGAAAGAAASPGCQRLVTGVIFTAFGSRAAGAR